MKRDKPTIALLTDHFLGDYQTIVRDTVEMTAKELGLGFYCFIGRALDAPNPSERIQNAIFDTISPQFFSGLVIMGATLSVYGGKTRVMEFCKQFAPLPICNIGICLDDIPSVVADNTAISDAVRHLAEAHGCRRFAYIGGPPANEEAQIRRKATLAALEALELPLDPALEQVGAFTINTGIHATLRLLQTGKSFDALVVANDIMAIGALKTLKKAGLRVPEDVKVTGFDDTPSGRFHSPSLTTLRQPLEEMGRYAVEAVTAQLDGSSVASCFEMQPALVRRQSCGCALQKRTVFQTAPAAESDAYQNCSEAFQARRAKVEQALLENTKIPEASFSRWTERLLTAIGEEIDGVDGRFCTEMDSILKASEYRLWLIDELQNAVSILRENLCPKHRVLKVDLESVWHEARLLLADAAAFGQMKNQTAADLTSALFLRRAGADLPSALTKEALINAVSAELETIGFENGWISVHPLNDENRLECIAAVWNGKPITPKGPPYAADTVVPPFLPINERMSIVVMPLCSGGDRLGIVALELGAPSLYYEMLREHMSSYLKSIAIHQNRVEELQAEADRQRKESEMQHRQKLESLGVLAGGIAHDFNNMLSAMAGNLDVALMDAAEQIVRTEPLNECRTVVRHASGLCRQLLNYSGKGSFLVRRTNLNRIIRELESLLHVSATRRATLKFQLSDTLPDIEADESQIHQIFVNLVINGAEAMGPEGGTVTIRTGTRVEDGSAPERGTSEPKIVPGNYVYVEVSDTGSGIEPDTLDRIFDPFFTTKFTGRGLGLAAVLGIVRGHRGVIQVESTPGVGTKFTVLFPRLPSASIAPRISAPPPEWKGKGRILLVDDEPTVLRAGARLLKRMGFSVVTATNGQEAVELFQNLYESLSAVILDITMPGKGGIATMHVLKEIFPGVPVVLTSGYSEQEAVHSLEPNGPAAFLQKPYDYIQLSEVLRRIPLSPP